MTRPAPRLLAPTAADFVMLSYTIAGQTILPFVPLYAQQLGMSNRAIGVLLSLPGLGAVLATLVASVWLARVGARRLLLGASLVAFVSLVAVWRWTSVGALGLFVPLFWAVQPLIAIAVQVLVVMRGAVVGRDRAVGMHSFYQSLGTSLGPLLGSAAIAATGTVETVFLAAATASLAGAAITLRTPDLRPTDLASSMTVRAGLRAVPVTARVAILAILVAEFCYVAWGTFFPLALKGVGVRPEGIGLVFAIYGAAISASRVTLAWLVPRVGRLGVLVASLGLMAVGMWFSVAPGGSLMPYVAAVLLGLGGLAFPITIVLVSAAAPPGGLGGLLAVRFLAITVGQMVGPVAAGIVAGASVGAALGAVAGLASATVVWVLWFRRQAGDTFLDTPKSAVLG
jgi:predicted MFS family arabinose efflux permease